MTALAGWLLLAMSGLVSLEVAAAAALEERAAPSAGISAAAAAGTGTESLTAATADAATTAAEADANWIRPSSADGALIWGRRDGLIFGVPSPGGLPGPRGLIRVGILGKDGTPALINFIAIEPVAKGAGSRSSRMAFSELEMSTLDKDQRGKRLTADPWAGDVATVSAKPRPIDQLRVRIDVEPFTANGTHVFVVATMSSDRPHEIALTVRHHDDSTPIEELTLTATMGNYPRLRHLWLRDRIVDSRELYAGYAGDGFIDKENYPHAEMLTYGDGDALVLATTNETDPASVTVPGSTWWTYKSIVLTQYWRVPAWHVQPDLRVKVNGRRVYWNSTRVIPGGLSFENFEVRQRYVPDQQVIFGLTPTAPKDFVPPIPRLASPQTPPALPQKE